jgi:ATP-dependent 26S proteasome regulatory subunit
VTAVAAEAPLALIERIDLLLDRVVEAVSSLRYVDPMPDDLVRGLYLTEGHVSRLLDLPGPLPFELAPLPPLAPGSLMELRDRIGGDDTDIDLLVIAAAPDVDPRFEKLYGYLNDDVTCRWPTVGVALKLAGCPLTSWRDRRRLTPDGRLLRAGLLGLEEPERPFLTRMIRPPDRVVQALLGETESPTEAVDVPAVWEPMVEAVVRGLRRGVRTFYVRHRSPADALAIAAGAFALADTKPVVVDLRLVGVHHAPADVVAEARREMSLGAPGVIVALADESGAADVPLVRSLLAVDGPVVVTGRQPWNPDLSARIPLVIDVAALTHGDRVSLWRGALASVGLEDVAPDLATVRAGAVEIERAVATARELADHDTNAVTIEHVRTGVRRQNGPRLETMARRIEPTARWPDLVLPSDRATELAELVDRVRHCAAVRERWGVRATRHADGVRALFAGPSGTGKTLAAEVVAGELGLDLYVVDLATVVDKYIGETEKHLDRIFHEAEQVNGILLFDEADALFGKRSEVSDAKDRYANVETAYLLQRMELFDGLAVLSTNLRGNLDGAFLRRLDVVVDFPAPDEPQRARLWTHFLRGLPVDDDVDIAFLAHAFELPGGHIRNIVTTSGFLAFARGGVVEMFDVITSVQREYGKLGRLCLPHEFGPYASLLMERD